jgi:3-hydroxybutyryl-CoA dehydrogenase
MTVSKLEHLTVAGAGVLGGQIAWHSAYKGKNVIVFNRSETGLESCRVAHETYAHIYKQDLGATDLEIEQTRARLTFTTNLEQAVSNADIVIEAIPEILDVKVKFYQSMQEFLPEHTILATNSSTLLPSDFAEFTGRPEKFGALHFANLIWSMNLAEVMAHQGTSNETLDDLTGFAIEIGMVPIPVEKEYNGYVINAMLVPIINAAQSLITKGVSTPEYIDKTYMIFNRGTSLGPCGIMDVVGFKTIYNVLSYWGKIKKDQDMLDNAQYIKEHFVDKGIQGIQGGKGYYQYPNPSFQAADFLDIPDISKAKEIAKMARLNA